MTIQSFIRNMKEIQNRVLEFLEEDENNEEYYQKIIQLFNDLQVSKKEKMIKSILHLLVNISKNHYREHNFYGKIDQIILYFKESMMKYFSNLEIFKLFQKDKRIILFLIKEKILVIDQLIVNKMCCQKFLSNKYPQFFAPEIKPFINRDNLIKELFIGMIDEDSEKLYTPEIHDIDINDEAIKNIDDLIQEISNELSDDFYKKREIGENDQYICELIQKDLIEEFIIYVQKEFIPLNKIVDSSIYETNSLLIQNKVTLIEYAAFYGSIQIFTYLYKNDVDLTSNLWIYGIHGKNPQIIHILEEKNILPNDVTFLECLKESIKCHHNDITNYFKTKLLSNNQMVNDEKIIDFCFHYYNFEFMPTNFNKSSFYCACKYDYYQIVEDFLKTKKIDIKKTIIKNI